MSGKKTKLLILDDEKDICSFVKLLFRKRGFLVYSALSGKSALEAIKKRKPNIMLIDIHLKKGMDGMEVLRKTRSLLPDCRCVMVTWDKTQAKIKKSRELGAAAYLTKPLTTTQLLEVINTVVKECKK